jgi:hypothetical protein
MALIESIDPLDLAQSGWAVIFPATEAPEARARQDAVREALKPLLDHRKAQAGALYREYAGPAGPRPGDSYLDFLVRQGAGPGPADPELVPYYLMVVGDPETIPYEFQYGLNVQYAVGRLDLGTAEEFARYARSVVEAEKNGVARRHRATFFGVQNPEDQAMRRCSDMLTRPLPEGLREGLYKADQSSTWELPAVLASDATKARLARLLGGDETPSLLFTASHGMSFDQDDSRQRGHQGALLCQDWPGPLHWPKKAPIPPAYYFSADDVGDDARLHGLIAFFYASHSAGTPQDDDLPVVARDGTSRGVPRRSFVAALPRRLLSLPRGGALAVVGHVGRASGFLTEWSGTVKQRSAIESSLRRILTGYTVGWATEYLKFGYSEGSVDLETDLEEIRFGKPPDDRELCGRWMATRDFRILTLLGDPAVRLPPDPPAAD